MVNSQWSIVNGKWVIAQQLMALRFCVVFVASHSNFALMTNDPIDK